MAAQDSQAGQSYLARLSPFTRSPAMPPSKGKDGEPEPLQRQQQGQDHVAAHRHRSTPRKYPSDCPPLRPQWFYAIDQPKRRPDPAGFRETGRENQPLPPPKKYTTFSTRDSKAIEAAYRKLAEDDEATGAGDWNSDIGLQQPQVDDQSDEKPNLSLQYDKKPGRVRVPVNEDYLFDVDVDRRELGPAYWLGPVYAVRRGSWFYQDGSILRPCDENLAEQLEDGYVKVKAWSLPSAKAQDRSRSNSQPRTLPNSLSPNMAVEDSSKPAASTPVTPKRSDPDLQKQATEHSATQQVELSGGGDDPPQNTYRLFGDAHKNSVVTYQDSTTAWLLTDDFMSRMNYSMYQRFAGGGHLGGVKVRRGYSDSVRRAEMKKDKMEDEKQASSKDEKQNDDPDGSKEDSADAEGGSETRMKKIERQMSSLLEKSKSENREQEEEDQRKRDEREMEEDYKEQEGDEQGREIEHLILITHGIGQRLGLRIESLNFVHDINTFRKTIKAIYSTSPDLRALNAELDSAEAVNSRVQVLPISWRHLLDFPKQSLKYNRKEHDLADTDFDDEDYPSLEDISVEGVPAVRNLITDLALDILLYQSPAYKDHISRIVLRECNRIYHLFMERNPMFKGKISLIGHSLGSAIMFDLLCAQGQEVPRSKRNNEDLQNLKFDFEIEDFYALGSPIGLFQMLKGRTVAARQPPSTKHGLFSASTDDPMLDTAAKVGKKIFNAPDIPSSDVPVSSPKCAQIFNIFHPTDPISYRMEPLISPAMSTLKPQPLPYTKKGIFGAPMGQGLTGLGSRVTQSVSGLWSSMASSMLTRGLGYSGNEGPQITKSAAKSSNPLATTGPSAANLPRAPIPVDGASIEKLSENVQGGVDGTGTGQHPPTLIDAELETLYSGFRKRRSSSQSDSEKRDLGAGPAGGTPEWQEAEERGKRLKREEEKVRRLNGNGRVDYAIQEGAFDINLIAAIASHLSYWSDDDVCHFIISQLLSRHRVVRPSSSGGSQAR